MKFFKTSINPSAKPSSLVILLHGWGANGRDLLSLAHYWQQDLKQTLFICPEAPHVCDENPAGFQWFSLGDWSSEAVSQGAEKAHETLDMFVQEQMSENDILPEKCVLMGFSQGMMMALYTGLRQKEPLAGILGYSGALVGTTANDLKDYPKTPISLIHGAHDPVVPVAMHHMAVNTLKEQGYTVDSLSIPGLPHGIDDAGLETGAEFIKRVLSS